MISFDMEQGRADYRFDIEGCTYRASFLHFCQTIVWTNITLGVGDTIKLDRPMASQTPHESLIRNEVVNQLEQLELLDA